MTDRLITRNVLMVRYDTISAGPRYHAFLNDIGIEVPLEGTGKPPAKFCLDWTERRHHISGPLATGIMQKFLETNWLERRTGSRALRITADGLDALECRFGVTQQDIVLAGAV